MAIAFISNPAAPGFALPQSTTPNGTEVLPADQTVSGTITTYGFTFASLMGPISISYANSTVSITGIASHVPLTVNSGGNANFPAIVATNPSAGGSQYQLYGTSNGAGLKGWALRVGSLGAFSITATDDSGNQGSDGFILSRNTSAQFLGATIPAPTPNDTTSLTVNGSELTLANSRTSIFTAANGDARVAISSNNATGSAGDAQLNLDTFGVQNWAFGNHRADGSIRLSNSQTLGSQDRVVFGPLGNSSNATFSAPTAGGGAAITATAFNAAGSAAYIVSGGASAAGYYDGNAAQGHASFAMNASGADFGVIGPFAANQVWCLGFGSTLGTISGSALKWTYLTSSSITAPVVIVGPGSSSISSFATASRSVLQIDGATGGDSLIDFSINGTTHAYVYSDGGNELRLNSVGSGTGHITMYTNAGLVWNVGASGSLWSNVATGGDPAVNGEINCTGLLINGVAVTTGFAETVVIRSSIGTVASNVTPANDTQLTIAISATGTYAIEVVAPFYNTAAATVGMKCNVNYSGTFTAAASNILFTTGVAAAGSANIASAQSTVIDSGNVGATAATPNVVLGKGVIIVTGAGTLGFAWSQNVSNATATSLSQGAYMKIKKIA